MCGMAELPKTKEKILGEVRIAAQDADIAAITKWSKAAEDCETFIQEISNLESRFMDFTNSLWPEQRQTSRNKAKKSIDYRKPITKRGISPKKEGSMAREDWIEGLSAKGINLNGHDKRYYTQTGSSVGIAFANELDKPQLVNKWFLGLKDESTDIAVLICKDREDKIYDFILPVKDMEFSWETLSKSGGQVKFHLQRKKEKFLLSIPRGEPIIINKYISNYQPLRGLAT